MKSVPTSVEESIVVKIGYEQTQRPFPLRYLVPLRTTERPPFVAALAAQSIVKEFNQRVVIIGPDLTGTSGAIGSFGTVVNSFFLLPPGEALVMIRGRNVADEYLYFHEDSLCRSHPEDCI